jgi:hypothetical protein
MKYLSLTIQKIWPMLVFADRQAKNYMPPIFRYGGIKKLIYTSVIRILKSTLRILTMLTDCYKLFTEKRSVDNREIFFDMSTFMDPYECVGVVTNY